MQKPFVWDSYADQPFPLEDRAYKRAHRWRNLPNILWTIFLGGLLLPLFYIARLFFSAKKPSIHDFFGMGINLDKEKNGIDQRLLIDELGIEHLLIRFPLWEMEKLSQYVAFTERFRDKHITLVLLPSRAHIEDEALLARDVGELFIAFAPTVEAYQVGNAINRTKWGFFSMGEYLRFFKTVRKIHRSMGQKSALWGPNIIDFEFYYAIHTLLSGVRFDGVSMQLYVDRRGSPRNRQWGLNLRGKIDLLYAIVQLSPQRSAPLYITEANWPRQNSAPYAPTSETECVDAAHYDAYMVDYFALAWQSQKVERVYWHQLVAKGYGLVDETTGEKYSAFDALKTLISTAKAQNGILPHPKGAL